MLVFIVHIDPNMGVILKTVQKTFDRVCYAANTGSTDQSYQHPTPVMTEANCSPLLNLLVDRNQTIMFFALWEKRLIVFIG